MAVLPITSDRPAEIPDGKTHLEYLLEEAAEGFEAGHEREAIANLAHAAYVAGTKREVVSQERQLELFRAVTNAAGCWE